MKLITLTKLFVLLLLLASSAAYGQQTPPVQEDDVVKVSTELVQVDAVVVDKDGNPVTDLNIRDFELLQDGKPQPITNLSYITRGSQNTGSKKNAQNNIPVPPVSSKATEFGRVITFIVDDGNCDSTQGGMFAAQKGLEKFVNEQMQPNDSVAIYQTRQGSKLIQQYTSDKAQLLTTIKKIRWVLPFIGCTTYGFDEEIQLRENTPLSKELQTLGKPQRVETPEQGTKQGFSDNVANLNQTVGAIGVLRYVINGLRRVGGRKLVFYLSDSLRIDDGKGKFFESLNNVRDLTALANRASVVINTIDVRGLTASVGDGIREPTIDTTALRSESDATTRKVAREGGLRLIANETGGKFYTNQNFLDAPIKQALKSETGYYLLAYEPDGEIFKGKKFHKIEVKLKRPNLNVSSRSGFFGVTDKELQPKPKTGDSELYEALVAPVPNADVNIKLSAYFINKADGSNMIRSLLHIEGKDIKFSEDANGMEKAAFDVVAVTLDEKGKIIDEFNRTHTVRVPAKYTKQIEQNGLTYTADVPIKKQGTYTFRIALREAREKRIGSSSQVIEVPDLKDKKLLVSGLIVGAVNAKGEMALPEETRAENAFAPVFSTDMPAVRQFRRNTILKYLYTVYNAKLNQGASQPNLSVQTNLYHNGNLISNGAPQPAQLEKQADLMRINDFGYMKLKPETQIGDYVLQIIVKDLQNNQVSSQWIDFEVVE